MKLLVDNHRIFALKIVLEIIGKILTHTYKY